MQLITKFYKREPRTRSTRRSTRSFDRCTRRSTRVGSERNLNSSARVKGSRRFSTQPITELKGGTSIPSHQGCSSELISKTSVSKDSLQRNYIQLIECQCDADIQGSSGHKKDPSTHRMIYPNRFTGIACAVYREDLNAVKELAK